MSIQGRCAKVKKIYPKYSKDHTCNQCEESTGMSMKQKWISNDKKMVKELKYLGDRVSTGGSCEDAVTRRAEFGIAMFMECGVLLCEKRSLSLKGIVYKNCARPAILYGNQLWCLHKRDAKNKDEINKK